MSRSSTTRHVKAIALAIIVAGAGVGCGTTAAAPGPDARTADASASGSAMSAHLRDADALIANASAAQRQHDWRSIRGFQAKLKELVGLQAISEARESYQRAVADLAASTVRGDSHARAGFRAELRAMCGPGGLVGAFESCDADLIVWGG